MNKNIYYDVMHTLEEVRLELVPIAHKNNDLKQAWSFVSSAIYGLEGIEVDNFENINQEDEICIERDQCRYARNYLQNYLDDNEDPEIKVLLDKIAKVVENLKTLKAA